MNIGVVLVTYNRLEKLKYALSCYENQTLRPKYILIVNNNSTDGTNEFLHSWINIRSNYKKYVYNLPKNTGGAGGFYKGQIEAEKLDAEWIYLSDDDAYPNIDALEKINETYNSLEEDKKKEIVSICSAVYNNGNIDIGHRVRVKKNLYMVKFPGVKINEYQNDYFDIDILSYVGSTIRLSALEKAGFVDRDLFIYFDDQDHSLRLRKFGRIIVSTQSIIIHDTTPKKYKDINWGKFYSTRNKLYLIKNNFSKYYYTLRYILGYLRDCVFEKNTVLKKMNKAAYKAVKKNIKGIDNIYKPGWKC